MDHKELLMIGFLIAGLLVLKNTGNVTEFFQGMPQRSIYRERVRQAGPSVGDFVEIPGTYQSLLSPNSGGGTLDYGSQILYNLPDNKHLRTVDYKASDPLTYANIVTENYCNSAGSCGANGSGMGNGLNNSGVANATAKTMNNLKYTDTTDLLPVQNMNGQILNAIGQEVQQPVIYDRFMYANQKSKLVQGADFIRGDLPIIPVETGWFLSLIHI